MTTLETLSHDQIIALRNEAGTAGDTEMHETCQRVLNDRADCDYAFGYADMINDRPDMAEDLNAIVMALSNAEAQEDAWWAWHDADDSRWSPGEDADVAAASAELRCAAWVAGDSDDGPARALRPR